MRRSQAEVLREYGPFPGIKHVHGVTFDGEKVWFASGDKLNALDPATGGLMRSIDVAGHAGTAFDGQHLFQIAEDRIQKIDPTTGTVVATIAAPGGGGDSGMAWAEGSLWVGEYRARRIHQVDPQSGAVLRTIECSRFVTGVTWTDGQLWHGTWEGEESDLRRIDPATGEVLEQLEMSLGTGSGWGQPLLLRRRNKRQGARRPPSRQARRLALPINATASQPSICANSHRFR